MAEDARPTNPYKQVPIVYQGLDELPIMFANMFLVQIEKSEFILAVGQVAPPVIRPGSPEEIKAQIDKIPFVGATMIARFGLTEERMRELVTLLVEQLRQYDDQRKGASQ